MTGTVSKQPCVSSLLEAEVGPFIPRDCKQKGHHPDDATNLRMFITKIEYVSLTFRWTSHDEKQDQDNLLFMNCKMQLQITFRDL